MKKCIGLFCLLFICLTANAEITFLDNPVWSTVLEKAKKENKMIFFDAYATWCGPCKQMDAETYKDKAVADYYNANFINVKYDMEKGEGPMLAGRYMVTAFPTLLFLNPEGVLAHKGVGFEVASEFVNLGKTAKDVTSQYYTLKKNAGNLTPAEFLKFAESARAVNDEEFDQLANEFLKKQKDILANADLINFVMTYANTLPDEKALAYFMANKAKVINTGSYTAAQVDEKAVALTVGYALSENLQTNPEDLDLDILKKLTEKYVPEKSFFVYNAFKIQVALNDKNLDVVTATLDTIFTNTPAKVSFDQACGMLINIGPILLEEGKLEPTFAKFDAIKLTSADTANAYMKNYVKAIIYIKNKKFDEFKTIANQLVASNDTPAQVKEDIKAVLVKLAEGKLLKLYHY